VPAGGDGGPGAGGGPGGGCAPAGRAPASPLALAGLLLALAAARRLSARG